MRRTILLAKLDREGVPKGAVADRVTSDPEDLRRYCEKEPFLFNGHIQLNVFRG